MRYGESHNNPVSAINTEDFSPSKNLSHGVSTNRIRVNLILLAEDRMLFPPFREAVITVGFFERQGIYLSP